MVIKKIKISGEIFGRKFKINALEKKLKKINFKLLETGVSASLNIFRNKSIFHVKWKFKGKIFKVKF